MLKKGLLLLTVVMIVAAALYYFYPEPALGSNITIDSLVVIKSKRVMKVYQRGELMKSYQVAIGQNASGDKQFE